MKNNQKYIDLFYQYFKKENDLLQIFVNPDVVNDMVYLSKSEGRGFSETYQDHLKEFTPATYLNALREGANPRSWGINNIQARIFMKPEYMTDSSKVQIKRYCKSQLNQRYYQKLREMVQDDVVDFLRKRHELTQDVMENPTLDIEHRALTPLQRILRHQMQADGSHYDLRPPETLFGIYLQNGDFEKVLGQSPNFNFFKNINNPNLTQSTSKEISPIELLSKDALKRLLDNYMEKIMN